MTRYWLMKTEPSVFSFEDLWNAPSRTTGWDGVRNYQARNFMRDDFRLGDQVLIYHSSTDEPGIVGIAEVAREAYPDETALDRKSPYFDEKSKQQGESRWVKVDVKAKAKFRQTVTLKACREDKRLAAMLLLQKGQRLSIQPVTPEQWRVICELAQTGPLP